MKTLFLFLAFSLCLVTPNSAQELEKSLLWEISGNGLTKPSYLFGTIHMICDASLNERVVKALDHTDQLVLEIDMDDPQMQVNMVKGMYMKDGKTLKDLVEKEDYELLKTFLKEQTGLTIENFANIKPLFITAFFYAKLLDCPMQSVEASLMKRTADQNEEVYGLETVDDQLQVFEDIPYEDQAKDLLSSAKDNLNYDKKNIDELLILYKNQDIEGINNLIKTDKNLTSTKYRDLLIDSRNQKWISKIEAFANEMPTFFGVGAGHLAGEKGVINLLKKQGFTVKAPK